MDVARLNFSHQTIDWHRERAVMIRDIAAQAGCPIGILQDLPGPKIRVGNFPDGPVELKAGQEFVLTTDGADGNIRGVSVNQKALVAAVEPGDPILLADGAIRLRALRIEDNSVVCEVAVGGKLGSYKGVNLPTRTLALSAMTDYDHEALVAGLDMGVDFVALSFVRSRDDVEVARKAMEDHGRHVPIIAKIEKHEALDNLDDIIEAVDAVMVARGDLAVEIPLWDVPKAQKRVIKAANEAAKPVITATQMLLSMVDSPRPARAETSDVANALYDGTDAIMLSEETAVGSYPVEALRCHRGAAVPARFLPAASGTPPPPGAGRRRRRRLHGGTTPRGRRPGRTHANRQHRDQSRRLPSQPTDCRHRHGSRYGRPHDLGVGSRADLRRRAADP